MQLPQFMPAWRVALYSAAIGLPLIAVIITAIIILLDSSGQAPRHSIESQFLDLPKYILTFSWPYVVLDIVVTLRLRKTQAPDATPTTRKAAMGAVIGMTIPYAIAYSVWPFEMSSNDNDAGQGVGILLILLGWVIGAIGAALGWVLGRRLERSHHGRRNAA